MFFSLPTSGWEDLPLLEDVPTWDDTPSPQYDLVTPYTPATPHRKCCFHPYHLDAHSPANALFTPPSPSFGSPSHRFSSQVQNSIMQALENGWAKSTLAGYSHHVTHFLTFCKQEQVPAALQFPADEFVLCAYVASDAGRISASTIQNWLSGLKAWHNAHVEWQSVPTGHHQRCQEFSPLFLQETPTSTNHHHHAPASLRGT